MSLIISKTKTGPRFRLASSLATMTDDGMPLMPHGMPLMPSMQMHSMHQWVDLYHEELEHICNDLFSLLCNVHIEGYSLVINRSALFSRLMDLAYRSSYNAFKRYRLLE